MVVQLEFIFLVTICEVWVQQATSDAVTSKYHARYLRNLVGMEMNQGYKDLSYQIQ